jgi:hypothetical protein
MVSLLSSALLCGTVQRLTLPRSAELFRATHFHALHPIAAQHAGSRLDATHSSLGLCSSALHLRLRSDAMRHGCLRSNTLRLLVQ